MSEKPEKSERSDSTREVLMEIGDRARGIVEELARQSRVRAEQAASGVADPAQAASRVADLMETAAAAATAGFGSRDDEGRGGAETSGLPADLVRRLGELRACVGQVADVLEGAVERLETVESQLGDPEAGVEEQLRQGIARCEDLLAGIGHRVLRTESTDDPGAGPEDDAGCLGDVVTVLVLSADSRRRARLCLVLEGQGLRALAASDLRSAEKLVNRHPAEVALIDLDPDHPGAPDLVERWNEAFDRGSLPRPLLVSSGGKGAGTDWTNDCERINEDHGEAALAARLTRMARGDSQEPAIAH